MPALTCDFNQILLTQPTKCANEMDKDGAFHVDADVQFSQTSLASLLGLTECGVTPLHAVGSAERGIVARHLWRALKTKKTPGSGAISGGGDDNNDDESILLACHRASADHSTRIRQRFRPLSIDDNLPNGDVANSRRRGDSLSRKPHLLAKKDERRSESSADGTLEGTPLAVDFASLDLPSELLETPSRLGCDDGEFVFGLDEDLDWIEPLPLGVARQLASGFNLVGKAGDCAGNNNNNGSGAEVKAVTPTSSSPALWIACDDVNNSNNDPIEFLSTRKSGFRETSVTTVSSRRVSNIDARVPVERILEDDDDDSDDDDDVNGISRCRDKRVRVSAFYLQRMSVLDDVDDGDDDNDEFSSSAVVGSRSKTSLKSEGRRRQMVIEVNWTWDSIVDKELMQTPAITDKSLDCRLHLTIGGSPNEDATKLGEGQIVILNFYEDMKKLQTFLRGLTSGGRQLVWFPIENDEDVDAKGPLIKRVEDLLRRERQQQQQQQPRQPRRSTTPTSPNPEDTDAGNPHDDAAIFGAVSKLDFVGKLWNLLKRSGSSRELQECLDRAVFGIVNASSIDALPTVFSISTSNVAKRIVATQERLLNGDDMGGMDAGEGSRKGSYRDDNPLIGLNPLLLLAELGIDKLRQEYHAFSTNLLPQLPLDKLVSGSSIYAGSHNDSKSSAKFLDPKDRCLSAFHRLVISHYVVDSLVQIKTFFPSVNLEEAAFKMAAALRKTPPKNMGDFKTMSLNLSLMEDVKQERLENPTSWMMTSTSNSTGSGGRVEAVHVSPFKALPVRSRDAAGNRGNFVLTRVSSITHSLG